VVRGGCTAVPVSAVFHHHEGRALRGEGTTVYFDQPGHENTADTLRLARARAEQVGIRDIVVASITGGLRRYHALHGTAVKDLRVTMPVSMRRDSYAREGVANGPAAG